MQRQAPIGDVPYQWWALAYRYVRLHRSYQEGLWFYFTVNLLSRAESARTHLSAAARQRSEQNRVPPRSVFEENVRYLLENGIDAESLVDLIQQNFVEQQRLLEGEN